MANEAFHTPKLFVRISELVKYLVFDNSIFQIEVDITVLAGTTAGCGSSYFVVTRRKY